MQRSQALLYTHCEHPVTFTFTGTFTGRGSRSGTRNETTIVTLLLSIVVEGVGKFSADPDAAAAAAVVAPRLADGAPRHQRAGAGPRDSNCPGGAVARGCDEVSSSNRAVMRARAVMRSDVVDARWGWGCEIFPAVCH